MGDYESWWDSLLPWLDAVSIHAGEVSWTGFQPHESQIDWSDEEGPIRLWSASGGSGPYFRRTLAACEEYVLDLTLVNDLHRQPIQWSIRAPLLRSIEPPHFPRPGIPLPLEAAWSVEWKSVASPKVRTSGDVGRGTEALRNASDEGEIWTIQRSGMQLLFLACHEPADRASVKMTAALVQSGRYTVRVTGDGFFDYWMLDPEHTPMRLELEGQTIQVGVGWGYVRLEHGRETSYGALRQDWGFA